MGYASDQLAPAVEEYRRAREAGACHASAMERVGLTQAIKYAAEVLLGVDERQAVKNAGMAGRPSGKAIQIRKQATMAQRDRRALRHSGPRDRNWLHLGSREREIAELEMKLKELRIARDAAIALQLADVSRAAKRSDAGDD